MELAKVKRVHCVGIGGIGVSAVARLFLARGMEVTGSDIRESSVVSELRKLGIVIHIGHSESNVPPGTELVIHTEDVNESSPGYVELKRGWEVGAKSLSYSQVLAEIMTGMKGIGVSGTNGKSTTTAMLGLIAEKSGIDPTVIVGSKVPALSGSIFQSNIRVGGSPLLIVEADEYHRHMLDARPWGIVITNINSDHLDYYKDLQDIQNAFEIYVSNLPEGGVLVYNADDSPSQQLVNQTKAKKFTFGFTDKADLNARNVRVLNNEQVFELVYSGKSLGDFNLRIPGQHNLANAMAATLMALQLEIGAEQIRSSLAEFPGIWRRFEVVGEVSGKKIISDYAHHPDGIAVTLQAAKQFYPNAKILTVFQPHQKSRTQKLYKEFLEALKNCDGLIITEIFSVVGREKIDIQISSASLVHDLQESVKDIAFARDLSETEALIKNKLANYDLVLFMGAGDIDNLARKLAS